MPVPFTGGCACGAIRYECSAEPLHMGNCHCRDCQRASGSAFFPGLYVPKTALAITGDVKYYDVQADSGYTLSRGFCPQCGSPLLLRPASFPNLMGLWAASLDDPSWYQPVADIWTTSAQPWDYMNPTLQKIEKRPTEDQVKELLTPKG